MKSLDTLRSLIAEQSEINARLAPLAAKSSERWSELNDLRQRQATAEAELDAAIQQAGLIEGRHLVGAADAEELAAAKQARQAAEKAHQSTIKATASIRALDAEVRGLQAASGPLAQRLALIAGEHAAAVEAYVRQLADEAAGRYAAAARNLAEESAAVMACNMALARMEAGVQPNLLTPLTQNMLVPAYNSPSASSPNGALQTDGTVRVLVPAAFARLKARIAADGVTVPGVSSA